MKPFSCCVWAKKSKSLLPLSPLSRTFSSLSLSLSNRSHSRDHLLSRALYSLSRSLLCLFIFTWSIKRVYLLLPVIIWVVFFLGSWVNLWISRELCWIPYDEPNIYVRNRRRQKGEGRKKRGKRNRKVRNKEERKDREWNLPCNSNLYFLALSVGSSNGLVFSCFHVLRGVVNSICNRKNVRNGNE